MNWLDLLTALSLVVLFEGILPFLAPNRAKRSAAMMLQMSNRSLRILGLTLMLVGVVSLTWVRHN